MQLFHTTLTLPSNTITGISSNAFNTGLYVQTSAPMINYVVCYGVAQPGSYFWGAEIATGDANSATNYVQIWNGPSHTGKGPSTEDCTIVTNGSNLLMIYMNQTLVYSSTKAGLNMPEPFNAYIEVESSDTRDMLWASYTDYYAMQSDVVTIQGVPAGDCGVGAPAAAPPATPKPAATVPAAQPRTGGTFRFAITADPASIDGQLATGASQETSWLVYDRLISYDLNLKPQPLLAENWDVSSDYKQFKLALRRGVQYHSGREFTSDDVKFSLLRPRDPAVGSGTLTAFSNWFTSIETPDKNTVVIKTDAPQPGFFDALELFNMVDKVNVEGPDAKSTIVGTGPFVFVEWAKGDHFTFTRNPNYWRSGRPYFDSVITYSRSQQAMVAQLEGGTLDAIKNPTIEDFARLKSDPKYQSLIHPNSGSFFEIGVNTVNKPFDDKRVRQAMNFAIDRKRFVDLILKGNGTPISLPWTQSSPAYDAARNGTYSYDLDKAKSLLSQAGVSGLETDILVYGSSQPQLLQFTEIYQASLGSIGVKLNIKNVQMSVWLDLVIKKKPEYTGFWAASDGFANVQPGSLFTLSPGWRAKNNHSAFENDAWSNFIKSVSSETDPVKQKQLYQDLNTFMLDESFTMPISTTPAMVVTSQKVHGLEFLMHNTAVSFTNTWLDA